MVARDFAAYLAGAFKPSVLPTIMAGALAGTLASGSVRKTTFNQAKALIKAIAKKHIKTQVFSLAQTDVKRFCRMLSDTIFGPPSARIPVVGLEQGDVFLYLIFVLQMTGYKRVAELLPATENPKRPGDLFTFSTSIRVHPSNKKVFLLARPTKQRRQRGSNAPEMLPFLTQFDAQEPTVSPGQVREIIINLARLHNIDLSKPLELVSPRRCRKGPLTQRKFRSWLQAKAKSLGFPEDFHKRATPRFIRKAAMSGALAVSDNPAITAKLVRHADPSTTFRHYHHPDETTLAQWQRAASSGTPILSPSKHLHRVVIIPGPSQDS